MEALGARVCLLALALVLTCCGEGGGAVAGGPLARSVEGSDSDPSGDSTNGDSEAPRRASDMAPGALDEARVEQGRQLVDQDLLAACLIHGGNCDVEVPGYRECMAKGLICNEREWRSLQEQWKADPEGRLSEAQVLRIAYGYADDAESLLSGAGEAVVEVVPTHAAELPAALRPAALPVTNDLVAVTVHSPITNTDVPAGTAWTTYEVYTVVVDSTSGGVVSICMGCAGL